MKPFPPRLFLMTLLACSAPLAAQRDLKNIPDPDPALQEARLQAGEGFEISLYASDPLLAKPIHMNFDARGRLWVASSAIYPQIKPGEPATDKVVILEDTDGDGKADRSTDFVGGLLIPTAVLPDARGGAYVGNSTELVHYTDDDGDGKADRETVVLSGFGTEDTHHILHTLRWGYDGRIYFNQSIYIHSHIETPHGVRRLGGGGIWQFRPETWKLEVLARGMVNSWGHHYDAWGQHFATDGAYGEGLNYIFPGSVFATAPGAKRILRGLNPGQPKECGLERISGGHFPPEMNGQWVTCDFRGNRVVRFELTDDRSGYASRQLPDLVKTDHIAFRPIDVKMGPDGALYIADWYNPIIQHGEVDFRDERRDRQHGRIWRLSWKGRPVIKSPAIPSAGTPELLEMLKADEDWVRQNARLELKARRAVDETLAWIHRLDTQHPAFERYRLEGLWTLQALNRAEPSLLKQVLASPDPRARAAAVRVLEEFSAQIPEVPALLKKAVTDEHPRVRLEAVHALRSLGTADAFDLALLALDAPMDENLDFALWTTARDTQGAWLPEFTKGSLFFKSDSKKVIFALKAIENPAALQPLVAALQENRLNDSEFPEVLNLLVQQGDGPVIDKLFESAMNTSLPAARRAALLQALDRAAAERKLTPSGSRDALLTAIRESDVAVRAPACRLAGRWKLATAEPLLAGLARSAEGDPALRQASIEALALLGSPSSLQAVAQLAGSEEPAGVRRTAVISLLTADEKQAAEAAARFLEKATTDDDPAPLFEAFARSKNAPSHLAGALKDRQISLPVALIGVQRIGAMRQDATNLLEALKKAGGVGQMSQQLSAEQLAALIRDVADKGDPHRGESIYRRPQLACVACHAIGGAGGAVGPDLVSIGASAPVDYLIESMLEPNKKIKEGYHTTVVTTSDGQVLTGTLHRQTDQELVLRDATGKLFNLRKDRVQNQQILPISLMPAGLTAQLRQDEFTDLIAFLSRLGKEGDFKMTPEPFVRAWRVQSGAEQPISNQLRRSSNVWVTGSDALLAWAPLTARVSGDIPLDELPVYKRFSDEKYSFLQITLRVSAGGKARLTADEPQTLEAWLGQTPVDLGKGELTLSEGTHLFTLSVDRRLRQTPVRVKLAPAEGSPARFEHSAE